MASFYAELHLGGAAYRVVRCRYACHQPTDARGRVQAKVRHDRLELTLDVPDGDALLAWAAAPHKPLPGEVVFYDVTQLVAHETIAFAAGECVGYAETFESGDGGDGAYACHLTLAATGFELRAGGPAALAAVVTPQLRQVAAQAASVAQTAHQASAVVLSAHETNAPNATGLIKRVIPETVLSPSLARILESTLMVANSAGPGGPEHFEAAVKADLQAIYDTPTGKQLLDSLHASGKRISIQYDPVNSAAFNRATWEKAFYQEDGVTPGQGVALPIEYNPFLGKAGDMPWNTRPPAIGLAHELIHAEQAAHGRMRRFNADNPGGPDHRNPKKPLVVPAYELDALGVHPEHQYSLTENKIRAEWNPPQGRRDYY
ncbi:MAG TPA: type VI secretion system tube protein TssD [Hymenobacter sp.]|jgi:hypothetical protein